jgi:hypothetical protein
MENKWLNCPLCVLLVEPDKTWGRSFVNCTVGNISNNYRGFFRFSYTYSWRTHCADLSDTVRTLFNWLHTVRYAYERCNIVHGTVWATASTGWRHGREIGNGGTTKPYMLKKGNEYRWIVTYSYFIPSEVWHSPIFHLIWLHEPICVLTQISSFLSFTYQQQCDCMYFVRLIAYRGRC